MLVDMGQTKKGKVHTKKNVSKIGFHYFKLSVLSRFYQTYVCPRFFKISLLMLWRQGEMSWLTAVSDVQLVESMNQRDLDNAAPLYMTKNQHDEDFGFIYVWEEAEMYHQSS